jgi:hypothetical protein
MRNILVGTGAVLVVGVVCGWRRSWLLGMAGAAAARCRWWATGGGSRR